MKICYITDTHLGAKGGSKIFRDYFRTYYKSVLFPAMKDANVDLIIHGGDFFDSRNAISTADIDYVMSEFIPLVKQYNIPMYVIVGNHDTHFKNTNDINSLVMMKGCDLITVVDQRLEVINIPNDQKKIVLCPWINVQNKDDLIDDLKFHADKNAILVGHFEINNFKMYKNSILSSGGLDQEIFKGYRQVLSGHFHHSSKAGNIEYLGALFTLNWDDHGDWRGYTLYDSQTDDYTKVENEFSLFTSIDYETCKDMSANDLIPICKDQIVRLVVDCEYDKIELKDFVVKINKCNPIQLDINDKTVINNLDDDTEVDDTIVGETKTFIDYALEEIKDNPKKDLVITKFDELYQLALSSRKDVV